MECHDVHTVCRGAVRERERDDVMVVQRRVFRRVVQCVRIVDLQHVSGGSVLEQR